MPQNTGPAPNPADIPAPSEHPPSSAEDACAGLPPSRVALRQTTRPAGPVHSAHLGHSGHPPSPAGDQVAGLRRASKSAPVSRRALLARLRPSGSELGFGEARPRPSALETDFGEAGSVAGYWIRVHRRIMACQFEVVLGEEDGAHVAAARDALDEADRLEGLLTVFRETSELTMVNRRARESAVKVGRELFELLESAQTIHRATDGAFDITSTPLSRCWGFLRRQGHLPSAEQIECARRAVGMDGVTLDPVTRTVRFERPGLELNLGSIGKGFALDRMATELTARGVTRALLSAGRSSVLALGHSGRAWPIDLRSTQHDRVLARLRLRAGALGTSGSGEQFVVVDGVHYGHVIDPRTGWPASGVLSASVITSRAAVADALSTAFLVGGLELAQRYCATHRHVLAVITPDDESRTPTVYGSFPGASVEVA